MQFLAAIAAGGAIGSVLRYLLSGRIMAMVSNGFPYGTLIVNILGGFAMGVIAEYLGRHYPEQNMLRLFLTTGILGGFTTFSAFSLETMVLLEKGELLLASFYIIASVVISVAALAGGVFIIRSFT
ncbi:MAG: fluoride efflux transporter CrcB [Proteobacteria bacterium]|nr:fluoride efflux transporter CrcB [Pseudomonadota bacterium]